eukprot:gnl/Chilomastix_cuspidata/4868.p2 GENE.gnl/Chilomastix_cuspidata/4868~~gnl/Chilomastix_cuspidata/4868.p2  ORF type:complete len:146 (-),score=4.61 gnl/Chilomastix_cuspidata/4868:386-823(-)
MGAHGHRQRLLCGRFAQPSALATAHPPTEEPSERCAVTDVHEFCTLVCCVWRGAACWHEPMADALARRAGLADARQSLSGAGGFAGATARSAGWGRKGPDSRAAAPPRAAGPTGAKYAAVSRRAAVRPCAGAAGAVRVVARIGAP